MKGSGDTAHRRTSEEERRGGEVGETRHRRELINIRMILTNKKIRWASENASFRLKTWMR